MNRFKIDANRGEEFEEVWRNRDRHLKEMKGFQSFQLLKGEATENYRFYISNSIWDSEDDFRAWTNSEQFKAAHGKSNLEKGVVLGPPQFEGFAVILTE